MRFDHSFGICSQYLDGLLVGVLHRPVRENKESRIKFSDGMNFCPIAPTSTFLMIFSLVFLWERNRYREIRLCRNRCTQLWVTLDILDSPAAFSLTGPVNVVRFLRRHVWYLSLIRAVFYVSHINRAYQLPQLVRIHAFTWISCAPFLSCPYRCLCPSTVSNRCR